MTVQRLEHVGIVVDGRRTPGSLLVVACQHRDVDGKVAQTWSSRVTLAAPGPVAARQYARVDSPVRPL